LAMDERIVKLRVEVMLANNICGPMDCGGLNFEGGTWAPRPEECFMLPGGLFKLQAEENEEGVIPYKILIEGESAALAAAATYSAWALLRKYGPRAIAGLESLAGAVPKTAAVELGASAALRVPLASASTGGGAAGGEAAAEAAIAQAGKKTIVKTAET